MEEKWSSWKDINQPAEYRKHAVYQIRLLDTKKMVVSISRFLGIDKEGILSIGRTSDMEQRRIQFISAENQGGNHSEGNLLFLLKRYSCFFKIFGNPQYQYCFKRVKNNMDAKDGESKLIKNYVKLLGEVPPLNSAIPERNDDRNWS